MKKSLLSIALLAITASSVNAASNENVNVRFTGKVEAATCCLLYTSPSPRDRG